ncbi:MAG: flagellar biosynthesis anti-sigma factor FlgM [Pirellulaceae bacterium]|nr:flagellar biosynthesis anti-sigma factor FlgM [Planctomycetales bacterium]
MQIQGPSSLHGASRTNLDAIRGAQRPDSVAPQQRNEGLQAADQLDISAEAEMVSRVSEAASARADRIAEIRRQIEAGTYETEAKLEVAVGRLFDEIAG